MSVYKRELLFLLAGSLSAQSMEDKARVLQRDVIEKHLVDGLYVSIVPAGAAMPHTVDDPANVIQDRKSVV